MKKILIITLILLSSSLVFAEPPELLNIGIKSKIYPIGWSKKGNFAYLFMYNIGGACGFCPRYDFVIQSMVTDKKLVTKTIEAFSEKAKDNIVPVKEVWENNRIEFKKYLKRFGIVSQKRYLTGGNSFKYKGRSYYLRFDSYTEKFKYKPFEAPEAVPPATIEMLASGKLVIEGAIGQKAIYRYKRKGNSTILNMNPIGFIQSPFEDRIAVFLKFEYLDSDGSPDEGLMFIGAHLKVRFN
ncbi:MAG: hypothetical protein GY793_00190 [Proteobacteria bacterium]|nr:hypothetical protein [Pseudomonadota bacterium]